jgi:RNA polymerase sigma factor (sigma-70 family)
MKKRRVLKVEQLEARATPDVSLGHAVAFPPPPADLAVAGQGTLPSPDPAPQADAAYAAERLGAANQSPASPVDEVDAFDWRSVRSLLADSKELARLLAGSTVPLPGVKPSTTAEQPGHGSNGQQSQPLDAVQAWRFLSNYTRKAIGNDEVRYGALPDHEDLIHQAFVEWREQVGPGEKALSSLLNKDSAERQVLRKTVRRVIDHTRYEQNRQKRMVELVDQPAPAKPAEREWIDLQIDWSLGVGNLTPREKQLLELRRQGRTFEEIGSELGLMKQRVSEMYSSAVDYLQELYAP